MLARFTKRPDGRHTLTIVRNDETVSQGRVIPGLGRGEIPHDLLHALVEQRLGLARGVYGTVNEGAEIADLLDPARVRASRSQPDLMHSEIVTTLLQAEAAYDGVEEDAFRGELARRCGEIGLPEPPISAEALADLRARRAEYAARWRALPAGETLDVVLSLPPSQRPGSPGGERIP